MSADTNKIGRFDVHEKCACNLHHYGPKGSNPSLKCNVCYPPGFMCGRPLEGEKQCGEIGCDNEEHADYREMIREQHWDTVHCYG